MSIYVKYGTIKGDATSDSHKGADGWWAAGSCSFGVSRAISTPTGATADRVPSQASVSDITLTKAQNTSTPDFFAEASAGKGVDCVIDYVQDGGQYEETYLTLKLTNSMISHWSSGSGGERPTESLSVSGTKIEVVSKTYDAEGTMIDSKSKTYNISTAKLEG